MTRFDDACRNLRRDPREDSETALDARDRADQIAPPAWLLAADASAGGDVPPTDAPPAGDPSRDSVG